jgi:hypothetical protein
MKIHCAVALTLLAGCASQRFIELQPRDHEKPVLGVINGRDLTLTLEDRAYRGPIEKASIPVYLPWGVPSDATAVLVGADGRQVTCDFAMRKAGSLGVCVDYNRRIYDVAF